jgi:hypothetical protein
MLRTPTGHCLTLHRRSVYAAAAAVLAAASLGGTATAFAKDGDGGGGGDARSRVACGAGGELELRAKEDDGGIEVKVKLDRNVAGEDWLVTLTDNGTVRLSETRTTGGSSGSFEMETLLMPNGTTPTGSSTSSTSATSTGSSTSSTSATKSSTPSTSATSTSSGSPTTDDHGGRVGLRAPSGAAAAATSPHTIEVAGVHGSLTCSTSVKL